MKFEYYPETDSGYLLLSDEMAMETRQILDGVNADFNAAGDLIGIEIERVTPPGRHNAAQPVSAARLASAGTAAAVGSLPSPAGNSVRQY